MLMPSLFNENLFDNFFDTPFRTYRPVYSTRTDLMKTDVKDIGNAYELSIAMPGVDKKDIQAELKDGVLTVSATTQNENNDKDENDHYIRRERFYGTCSRSFSVDENVKQEDIKAKYENGVLTVLVPKKEAQQPEVEEKKYINIEG